MPKKRFQFEVPSRHKPSLEINETGIYVRFQPGVKATETIIRSEWPHVAVDIAKDGSVVGIECVPVPNQFSLDTIARKAGVKLPARLSAADVQISAPTRSSAPVTVA